jgi:hypothetical protein
MTDEVKAALQAFREQECDECDLFTIAHAFAAEHPPDDDEPVTLEELKKLNQPDFYSGRTAQGGLWLTLTDQTHFNPTRGQLRKLLSALEER